MAQLARQGADLPAVVNVVRDQVAEHAHHVRAEAFHFAFGVVDRVGQKLCAALRAFGERLHGFLLGDGRTVELIGQRLALGCGHQPHVADVVHVRGDGGDSTPLAAGWFGVPSGIGQILQQVLVDALVDRVGLQQRDLEVKGRRRFGRD